MERVDTVRCLIPGSFDPPTLGHRDVIERVHVWAGEVIVAVMDNPAKTYRFSLAQRQELMRQTCEGLDRVTVVSADNDLVTRVAERHGAQIIVKGCRNPTDVSYEWPMADLNRRMTGVETLLMPSSPQWASVSSSLVREIADRDGDVSSYVHPAVAHVLSAPPLA